MDHTRIRLGLNSRAVFLTVPIGQLKTSLSYRCIFLGACLALASLGYGQSNGGELGGASGTTPLPPQGEFAASAAADAFESMGGAGMSSVIKMEESTTRRLQVVDWKQIRAEYERQRHAAISDGTGFKASNFRQHWMTRFDGRGVTVEPDGAQWSWGLELAGGYSKPRVSTDGNRVIYHWSADLEEWFANGQRGLEHGFTMKTPHQIRLIVRGGLEARNSADGIEFVDGKGAARMTYRELAVWDAGGRRLPARMHVQERQVVFEIDDREATYPIRIDPIAQQAHLKSSNTDLGDRFGRTVAVSGDTVVVGAPGEASNATGVNGNQSDKSLPGSGAAYVFVRSGTTWVQQAYLKPSNTGRLQEFGSSVAISGDTIVVGAPGEASNTIQVNGDQSDHSAPGTGAAYVFVREGTAWSQRAYLKASNADRLDRFGFAVGVSGGTVVVGAPAKFSNATRVKGNQGDNSSPGSGAAYVFVLIGTEWSQQAYLKASNAEASYLFGHSVTVSGDTVGVGAPGEASHGNPSDNGTKGSGAAYVFARTGTDWSQQAYLKGSSADASDAFGHSIGMSGDIVVVGAPGEASNGTTIANNAKGSGAAYVFARSGTEWSQQGYLKATNASPSIEFGHSVAASGNTIVVGAPREGSGAAYVFVRSETGWILQTNLQAANLGAGGQFGYAAATSGETIVVAAPGEGSNASGAAYTFPITSDVISVRIDSSPPGLQFSSSGAGCAGSNYITPQVLSWAPGSSCILTFSSPQIVGTTKYVLTNWEDNSTSESRSITAPGAPATYTATFAGATKFKASAPSQSCIDNAVIACFDGCTNPLNLQECIIGCSAGGSDDLQKCADNCFGDSFCEMKCETTVRAIQACKPPVFTVSVTDSGSGIFTQGDSGRTFLATVNNTAGAATTETTTLVLNLSDATMLVPTQIAGQGWTCPPPLTGSITCTSTDAVSAGSSFPAVTLTVNVAANAGSPQTLTATASGGGGGDPAVTSDMVTILRTQTITFGAIPSHTFGDAAFSVSPSASSALPVTVTRVSGPCTATDANGSTITITGAGVCLLQADQAGNATYHAAPSVQQSFQINKASQSVTFGPISSTALGTSPFPVSASASSSLPVSFASQTMGVCTVSANTVTLVAPGMCSLRASQAGNSNYDAAMPVTQSFSVLGADLTIQKKHSGNHFSQGQIGAIYTITVSNIGPGITSGQVQTVDTLPSGLTAPAIGGSGWSCTLNTRTCTRSDVLAVSGSYPDITITVNVASNAPASVTNSASASGGGEVNLSNDTALDPTTINTVANVSGQVSVTQNGFGYNRATQLWSAIMTVSNKSGSPISGPLQVVLSNLTPGVTMVNQNGDRNGSPYITVLNSGGFLAAGASLNVSIQFRNPSSAVINFTAETDRSAF